MQGTRGRKAVLSPCAQPCCSLPSPRSAPRAAGLCPQGAWAAPWSPGGLGSFSRSLARGFVACCLGLDRLSSATRARLWEWHHPYPGLLLSSPCVALLLFPGALQQVSLQQTLPGARERLPFLPDPDGFCHTRGQLRRTQGQEPGGGAVSRRYGLPCTHTAAHLLLMQQEHGCPSQCSGKPTPTLLVVGRAATQQRRVHLGHTGSSR